MDDRDDVLFSEVQRFNQLWIWAIIVPISVGPPILFGYGLYRQLIGGDPWGDNPLSDLGLVIAFLFCLAFGLVLLLLFIKMRLLVAVRPGELWLRFAPLHLSFKRFALDEFSSHRALTYRPIAEYGGWGIRLVSQGRAYNVSGNRGVRFDYPDGRHLLVGSQHADELARAVDAALARAEENEPDSEDGGL
jgi:hypothetical protein